MYVLRFFVLWLASILGVSAIYFYFHGAIVSEPRILFVTFVMALAIMLRRYRLNSRQ